MNSSESIWIEIEGKPYYKNEKRRVYEKLNCPCDEKKKCLLIMFHRTKFFRHYESEMKKRNLPIPNYSFICNLDESGSLVHRHSTFAAFISHQQRVLQRVC